MHVNTKFLACFSSGIVQKVDDTTGHILCSFSQAIHRYIDCGARSRRNKIFQTFVWGC